MPAGLPRSGKNVWKMIVFPGFSQGNLENDEKSQGIVREFQNFPKIVIVLAVALKV